MHNKYMLFIFLFFIPLGMMAQPVNDNCSDAISIPVESGTCTTPVYTTTDATLEATDPAPTCWFPDGPDENVWFTFTATTAAVEISTFFDGTIANTQVAVFSGTCGSFTQIACQEDLDPGLGITDVMIYVDGLTPGVTYYIMVDGNFGQSGTFGICVQEMTPWPEPSGDDCPEAVFLCSKDDLFVPDGTGSDGALEEVPSCFGSGEIASDWYTFTAANSGTLTFNITPSGAVNFDWAVYDISMSPGALCNLSDELACNSAVSTGITGAGCGGAACSPALSLIAGHTYALLINRETAAFSSGYTLSFGGTAGFDAPATGFEYDAFVCVGESDPFEVEVPGDGMYFWSFGDGGTAVGEEPNHTYTSAGTYEVVLLSFSPGGCPAVALGSVSVSDGPDLSIVPEDPVICLGDGVTLDLTYVLTEDCEPFTFIMDEGFEIPDDEILSIPIPVTGVVPAVVSPGIIASVCIDIEHTNDADLDIWLQCPDGTLIELSTDNGGTGNDYSGTCFVPTGASSVTTGTAPFAGSYLPEQPFTDLTGCNTNGVWHIVVTDDSPGGELGSIEFASITFACDVVPASIVWSPATGLSSTTVEDPYASPTVTTTYTVTVTDVGGCSSDTTVTVTVVDGASAGFSYPGTPYCTGDADPLPVLDAGASAGSWSASPAGLAIDAMTGEVDLSLSAAGTYTITNYVSAVGSCPDAVATYDIVIDTSATFFIAAAICSGETYILPDGSTTNTAGTYTVVLATATGCDSVVTATLTLTPTYALTEDVEICEGGSYTLPDGTVVSTEGTFVSNLTTVDGCDSVITTTLTLTPTLTTTLDASICAGDSYILPDGSATSTAGSYSFTFTSASGCDSVVTATLTLTPTYAATEDVEICEGGSYTLPDGTVVSTEGTFVSNLTTVDGCDSVITTTLTLTPTLTTTLDASICAGDSYILPDGSATSTAGSYSFTFTSASGCDSVVTATLTLTPTYALTEDVEICEGGSYTLPDGTVVSTGGTFVFNLTTVDGCDSVVTIHLELSPLPVAVVNFDVAGICFDGGWQEATVSPAGGVLSGTGITATHFDPALAGPGGPYIIQYIYTSALGCADTAYTEIEVFPLPAVDLFAPSIACIEADPILLTGNPIGGVFTGEGVVDSFFMPSLAGTGAAAVTYSYTDGNGCAASSIVYIDVVQNMVDAGPDVTINIGDSALLYVVSDGSLIWSPATGLSCEDCADPIASPLQTTTYLLTETDGNGCLATDLITVTVEASEEYTIFIPNSFTPNGDLANDYFLPMGFNIQRILTLRIYDRWGMLMYENGDILPGDYIGGWDGTFKGKPVNPGVYAYVVEFLLPDGSVLQRGGNVTLLR